MSYSRRYLNTFKDEKFGTEEHISVTESLLNKLIHKEELTLAEEEYICFSLTTMKTESPMPELLPFNYEGCKNYWFRNRYLLYFKDLNGNGRIFDFKGEIELDQKNQDVNFLESEYQNWVKTINANNNEDVLLDYLSTETKHHLNKLNKYCISQSIGRFRREYLEKSIVLHSRFIYFLVKEYYQELGEQEEKIEGLGHTFLIDSFCYIHILFRHFASFIKEYQNMKTYHYDTNIDYKNIPNFLKEIITLFKDNFKAANFDGRSITLSINNQIYTIWFRSLTVNKSKGVTETYLRLQTFYPLRLQSDLQRTNELGRIQINQSLAFLIKKI